MVARLLAHGMALADLGVEIDGTRHEWRLQGDCSAGAQVVVQLAQIKAVAAVGVKVVKQPTSVFSGDRAHQPECHR